MSTAQQIDWTKYTAPPAAAPQQIDFSKYESAATPPSTPQPQQGLLSKVWDAVNKPIADFVLPKGISTSDIVRGAAFQKLFWEPYIPGVNDFDTKAEVHLGDSPTKAAVKTFIAGSAKDASDMAASFTSPLSLATVAAGAAGKIPGAIGKVASALSGAAGVGFAAKGVGDIQQSGWENTPDAWKRRLLGAAQVAGGSAAAGGGAGTMIDATKRAMLLGRTPEQAYESALKPSTTIPAGKRAQMIDTALQQGIPVSRAGLEKLGDLIDNLNDKITDEIGAGQGKTVNKFAVASRLRSVAQQAANQVNPEGDLAAVSASGNEFLRNQPNDIPATTAQALKQGTYKSLGDKAYGELGSATIESQKALARGLKEELATAFPEINNLNKMEGRALDLQPVLERAVNRIANHQMLGIGTPIAAGAAKAVTGSSVIAGITGVLKAVLDDPIVKSRLAISVSKGGASRGLTLPQAFAQVDSYSNALSVAAANALHPQNHNEQ